MTASDRQGVGEVVSADIAVPQHERELRFYARVLTTGEQPLWRDDLMNSAGTPIIGLGKESPEYSQLPLQWMPHIQVADVGASARSALSRGGSEVMHHRGEDGRSQWAVLLDPNGAAFGIIPAVAPEAVRTNRAARSRDRAGRISWLDLTVAEASATRDFYRDVIGWSVQDVDMEDSGAPYADYALLAPDGTTVAGVRHARGVNRNVPPVWLIHLPVGDLGDSIEVVQEEGGEVVESRKGDGDDYEYALVRDPVGAYLALVSG